MRTNSSPAVSLTHRLILALVFTITIIMVLVAGSFYIYTEAELERNFADDVNETMSYLEGSLGRLLWFYDHDSVARVTQTVLHNELVVSITIRDEQKKKTISVSDQKASEVLIETRPLYFNDFTMGEVEVHFSQVQLKQALERILWIVLSVWLLTVLSIVLLTSLFVRRHFRGPLNSFIQLTYNI